MEAGKEQERRKGLHRMVQGLEEGARDSVLYSVGKGKVRGARERSDGSAGWSLEEWGGRSLEVRRTVRAQSC